MSRLSCSRLFLSVIQDQQSRVKNNFTLPIVPKIYHPGHLGSHYGLRALMLAETTKFSAPLPGSHCLITSLDSSFGSMEMSTNPAFVKIVSSSFCAGAPATQHDKASAVRRLRGRMTPDLVITSLIATRPPKQDVQVNKYNFWL